MFYCIFNGFSGQTLFDSWVLTFLNTFFTSIPPVISGVFEKDVREEVIEKHPELYKTLKTSGALFSLRSVALFVFMALYHSAGMEVF